MFHFGFLKTLEQGKKRGSIDCGGQSRETYFIAVVHNQKYKTVESQSIDCMEGCSYTSLQVQGHFILLIKTPRGEGFKERNCNHQSLEQEGYLYLLLFLGFKVPHVCVCLGRRWKSCPATGLQWSSSQIQPTAVLYTVKEMVLICIWREVTEMKGSKYYQQW